MIAVNKVPNNPNALRGANALKLFSSDNGSKTTADRNTSAPLRVARTAGACNF